MNKIINTAIKAIISDENAGSLYAAGALTILFFTLHHVQQIL